MYYRPEELRQFWDYLKTSWQFRTVALAVVGGIIFFNYFYHWKFKRFISKGRQTLSYLYIIIILLNVLYYWFTWDKTTPPDNSKPRYDKYRYQHNTKSDNSDPFQARLDKFRSSQAQASDTKGTDKADTTGDNRKQLGFLLKDAMLSKFKRHPRNVSALKKKIVAANQQWKCGICGQMLDETYEVDHIVPLYQGGTNDISNLMALDPICHKKKTFRQQYVG